MIDRYGDRFLLEGGPGSGNFGHAGRPGSTGGSAPGVVSKVRSGLREGGITISTHGDVPSSGFAVAAGAEQQYNRDVTTKDIAAYIDAHKTELRSSNAYLGAWVDKGTVYLDVSHVFAERSTALQAARQRNELAIYDLAKGETIFTMEDQKRPAESKAKFTESANFNRQAHMIFGSNLTLGQIAATINAARNAQK